MANAGTLLGANGQPLSMAPMVTAGSITHAGIEGVALSVARPHSLNARTTSAASSID